jgi:hypothetical protein
MRSVHVLAIASFVAPSACIPSERAPQPAVIAPVEIRSPPRSAPSPAAASAAAPPQPASERREPAMPFVDTGGYLDHPYRDVLVEEIGRVLGLVCDGWTNGADVRIDGDEIAELVWYDGVSERGTPLVQHVGKKVSRPPPELAEFFRGDVRVGLCVSYVQNPALAR